MQTCFCLCVICLGLESVLGGKLGEVGSLLVMEEYRRCYSHAIQIRRCYSLVQLNSTTPNTA